MQRLKQYILYLVALSFFFGKEEIWKLVSFEDVRISLIIAALPKLRRGINVRNARKATEDYWEILN